MNTARISKSKFQSSLLPWLDVIAIIAWGLLLLKYWVTDKLGLLIHPNYFPLVVVGAIALLAIGSLKVWSMVKPRRRSSASRMTASPNQHISLFPPGWSTVLLLITAIVGFTITPRPFSSQTALDRGVTDTLLISRAQPKEFKTAKRPEDRSLIDWIRTLNVYPEPDDYTGQKAKVSGFVVHSKELPDNFLLLSRFILTCCAADAYPVGLPVKLNSSRTAFAPDTWLEVEGQMITETLGGKRQLTIQANSIKTIPEPKNPYDY